MWALLAITLARAQDAPPEAGLTPSLGLYVGPSFHLTPLQPSLLPTLELGLVLQRAGGRLEPVVGLSRSHATATSKDDSDGWTLRQQTTTVGLGLNLRLYEQGAPLNPELCLGGQVHLQNSVVDGWQGDSWFGESTEKSVRMGSRVALGLGWSVGPGALTGRLSWSQTSYRGQLTGAVTGAGISPSVGYRLVL